MTDLNTLAHQLANPKILRCTVDDYCDPECVLDIGKPTDCDLAEEALLKGGREHCQYWRSEYPNEVEDYSTHQENAVSKIFKAIVSLGYEVELQGSSIGFQCRCRLDTPNDEEPWKYSVRYPDPEVCIAEIAERILNNQEVVCG
jgi:hypothetical protein